MTDTLGAKISHCSLDLRMISEKETDLDDFSLRKAETRPAMVHSAPSLLKFSPWCPSQGRLHHSLQDPFPREAGSSSLSPTY